MNKIDLHVHSKYSNDGEFGIKDIIEKCIDNKITTLSITDHNNIRGIEEAISICKQLSIELIPGRNDFHILKDFVNFFNDNGFVITFGTEHNTPQLDPMKISCGGGIDLDEELKQINYEGTAVIAAHQYLIATGKEGYLKNGIAKIKEKTDFIELGKAVISKFIK